MAKETVLAVRQAEEKAAQIEKEATLKGEEMIQKAKDEAKILVSSMTKENLKAAEKKLADTQITGEKLMKEALQKAEKEIILLKEIVKSKEQSAINLCLSEVI